MPLSADHLPRSLWSGAVVLSATLPSVNESCTAELENYHHISILAKPSHSLWNRAFLLRFPRHERHPPMPTPVSPPTIYFLPNSTIKEPCLIKSPSASQHNQHA
ncbi:hypothetical protein ABVK25_000258 [Lepraria finkii]|uniref:Secreted protein n=1 Tax=Lepraria finkii TaxID=1340010 RepID=A0ABR4BQ17_9LECA